MYRNESIMHIGNFCDNGADFYNEILYLGGWCKLDKFALFHASPIASEFNEKSCGPKDVIEYDEIPGVWIDTTGVFKDCICRYMIE